MGYRGGINDNGASLLLLCVGNRFSLLTCLPVTLGGILSINREGSEKVSPFVIGILGIVVLIVLLFSGMSVALVMSFVGFLGFSIIVSPEAALSLLAKDIFGAASKYSLTVIPMFILMGQFPFYSRAGNRAFDSAYKFLGRVRGGLAMATTMACAIFAALCGSTNAGAAAMGPICIPEMRRYN